MSRVELEERRQKGLCFKCRQQYYPLHKCPKGEFRNLLLSDDEGLDEMGEEEAEEGECQILDFMGMAQLLDPVSEDLKAKGGVKGLPI